MRTWRCRPRWRNRFLHQRIRHQEVHGSRSRLLVQRKHRNGFQMVLPTNKYIDSRDRFGNRHGQGKHRQDCGCLHHQWSCILDHGKELSRWCRWQDRLVSAVKRRTQSVVPLRPSTVRGHDSLFECRHPARRIPRVELLEFHPTQLDNCLVPTHERRGAGRRGRHKEHLRLVTANSGIRPCRVAGVVATERPSGRC